MNLLGTAMGILGLIWQWCSTMGCKVGIWQPMEAFLVITTRGGGCYRHPAGGIVKSPQCAGQPSQLRINWPPTVSVEKQWSMVLGKRKVV